MAAEKGDNMSDCMRWAMCEQWNIISLDFRASQIFMWES